MLENAEFIARRLTEAGLDDICVDESFLLGVMVRVSRAEIAATLAKLGTAEREAIALIRSLARRGYVRPRSKAAGGSKPAGILTERGHVALALAETAVKAVRWSDLRFRRGDIVISTPVKCGTTWVQMICALLIFQIPDLPAPLPELSPWLDEGAGDWRERADALAAQRHRRFIKTHLPLSEIPTADGVTYIVVGRHLLDAAISFHSHISKVASRSEQFSGPGPQPRARPSPHDWLLQWITMDTALHIPPEYLLPGMLKHLTEAWRRRGEPNVILLHYEELSADLAGEMRRLAERLAISVPEAAWPALVKAATFDEMRAAAGRIQPERWLKDSPTSFFRKGVSGSGRDLLTDAELAYYYTRTAQLAPPDLLAWLHRTPEARQTGHQ